MLKTLLWLYILVTLVLPNLVMANTACLRSYEELSKYPSLYTLENNLYAVHLTDYLPEEGVIKAVTGNRARFSPTLHFSLGGPVISHAGGDWTNKNYAILLPLKYLKPQLLNIYSQDTYILGDLELPKTAILLLPEGVKAPNGFKGQIRYYNQKSSINLAVKEQLEKEQSLTLESTGPMRSDPTYYQGKKINEELFYYDFISPDKKVSHRLHSETVMGKLDRGLMYFFVNWFYRKVPANKTLEDLEYKKLIFQQQFAFVQQELSQRNFSKKTLKNFLKAKKDFEGLMNIIELEILAQKKYGKSVLNINEPYQTEILKRQFSMLELQKYFLENQELFPEKTPQYGERGEFVMEADKDLYFLSYEQFSKVVKNHQQQTPQSSAFEYEITLLRKAIAAHNSQHLNADILQEQFLKVVGILPNYMIAEMKSLLAKISDKSLQALIMNNVLVKEKLKI